MHRYNRVRFEGVGNLGCRPTCLLVSCIHFCCSSSTCCFHGFGAVETVPAISGAYEKAKRGGGKIEKKIHKNRTCSPLRSYQVVSVRLDLEIGKIKAFEMWSQQLFT